MSKTPNAMREVRRIKLDHLAIDLAAIADYPLRPDAADVNVFRDALTVVRDYNALASRVEALEAAIDDCISDLEYKGADASDLPVVARKLRAALSPTEDRT